MKALITGASSGIGRDMARYLASLGHDLILVARREDRLLSLKSEIQNVDIKVIKCDVSDIDQCKSLYNQLKEENIDILINNAGFGLAGKFTETDLDKEVSMINTNITGLHVLTKFFLKDFVKRDSGYILNVASSAAFMAGPLLSTYYATKNYVLRLTEAIFEELKKDGSNVHVSVLCPGPVDTEFNDVADVAFALKGLKSKDVAKLGIDKMFKNKLIIIPGFIMKSGLFFKRFLPEKILLSISYMVQKKKN